MGYLGSRVPRQKADKRGADLTDSEVRTILVHAMADLGADPALVYAFQKTGVYICDENEKRLPKASLKAFDGAVDEYFAALNRQPQ
jgi:transcriptional/translational regulatory protein YebC/TACO1